MAEQQVAAWERLKRVLDAFSPTEQSLLWYVAGWGESLEKWSRRHDSLNRHNARGILGVVGEKLPTHYGLTTVTRN